MKRQIGVRQGIHCSQLLAILFAPGLGLCCVHMEKAEEGFGDIRVGHDWLN